MRYLKVLSVTCVARSESVWLNSLFTFFLQIYSSTLVCYGARSCCDAVRFCGVVSMRAYNVLRNAHQLSDEENNIHNIHNIHNYVFGYVKWRENNIDILCMRIYNGMCVSKNK